MKTISMKKPKVDAETSKKVDLKKTSAENLKKLKGFKKKSTAKQTREQQEEGLLIKNMIIIAAIAMYYAISKIASGLVSEGIVIAVAVAVVIATFFILKKCYSFYWRFNNS